MYSRVPHLFVDTIKPIVLYLSDSRRVEVQMTREPSRMAGGHSSISSLTVCIYNQKCKDCPNHQHLERNSKQCCPQVIWPDMSTPCSYFHWGCDPSQLTYVTIAWKIPVPDVRA